MKNIFLTLLVSLTSITTQAQTVNLEWVKSIGGSAWDHCQSIATDASGNVYVTGYYRGTVDFDPGPATLNLSSNGDLEIFVLKLDPQGDLVWAKSIGGASGDYGYALATDALGDVYVTGYYRGMVDFDPGSGTTFFMTSVGADDIFVMKLDTNGNFLWAKSMGGSQNESSFSITTDGIGNLYVSGRFSGTVDFDPGTGVFNLASNGSSDVFIQKLDVNGNFVWAKSVGGPSADAGYSITTDALGDVYLAGWFGGTVDFDPSGTGFPLTSNGSDDVFIQKLTAHGNFIWAKSFGGTATDYAYSIAVDATSSSLYVTGFYTGTVDFDPGISSFTLVSNGGTDTYIQKLDTSGNFIWAKSLGGTGGDLAYSITTDMMGNIYLIGDYEGTVDFDFGPATYNLTSAGATDIYAQKLAADGSFVWAISMGAGADDDGRAILTDGSGNVYTTGAFQSITDFDPNTGITTLTSNGSRDVFIQKLNQCAPIASTDIVTACDSITWIDGVTYSTSNNTATYTLSTAAGCDSVVTLDLTILNSAAGTDTKLELDSFTWIDGITYNSSNSTATYNLIGGAANGCDSLVTLDLTIVDCSYFTCGKRNNKIIVCHNGKEICISPSALPAHQAHGDQCGPCDELAKSYHTESSAEEHSMHANPIVLYPNPFNNIFTIDLYTVWPGESVEVRIFDVLGNLVNIVNVHDSSRVNIDMTGMKSGLYIYTISNNEGVIATGKVAKN